ncbi:MAG: tRNA pseudouridine(13) synthase TruD [Natronospirillum sp.]
MDSTTDHPAAWGQPLGQVTIRQHPEDFQVTELLTPDPVTAATGGTDAGQSEHLWLWIEKVGDNTAWVGQQLAQHFSVRVRDVSWAGLKDRHAVAKQWFSVWLPGGQKQDQWTLPTSASFRVIGHQWCTRKIRRGAHDGNRFVIRLAGWCPSDQAAVAARLQQIIEFGVPNYYGPQRFGYDFNAQPTPVVWTDDRQARGLQISAMRSHLFNLQLAERVRQGTWNQCIPGQWVCWRGSQAGFVLADLDPRLQNKVSAGELSPSAWLPGEVKDQSLGPSAAELAVLAPYQVWIEQLAARRVQAARRATVLRPRACSLEIRADDAVITFELPPGAFATTVLQALWSIEDAARYSATATGHQNAQSQRQELTQRSEGQGVMTGKAV